MLSLGEVTMDLFSALGRLSGVMDDRGKFIYISQEEMHAVADYIKRQGRVSISHLASKSNQFIDLEPKAQVVDDISGVEEMAVTWLGIEPWFYVVIHTETICQVHDVE